LRKNKNFEKHKLYWLAFDHLKKSAYSGNPEGQYDYAQQFDSISFLGVNNPLYNPRNVSIGIQSPLLVAMQRLIITWRIFMKEAKGFGKI